MPSCSGQDKLITEFEGKSTFSLQAYCQRFEYSVPELVHELNTISRNSGGVSHLEIPCYLKSHRLWWHLCLFWTMPVAQHSLISWRLKCSCLIKVIGLHVAVSGWCLMAYDAQEIMLDELIIYLVLIIMEVYDWRELATTFFWLLLSPSAKCLEICVTVRGQCIIVWPIRKYMECKNQKDGKIKCSWDLPVNSLCMKNRALYSVFIFHWHTG